MSIEALLDENIAAHMREKRVAAQAALALSNVEASGAGPEALAASPEERINDAERQEQLEAYHRPRRDSIDKLKDRPGKRKGSVPLPSSMPLPGADAVLDC